MASAVMIEVGVFRPESVPPAPPPIISASMGDMIPALSAVKGFDGVPGFDDAVLEAYNVIGGVPLGRLKRDCLDPLLSSCRSSLDSKISERSMLEVTLDPSSIVEK